MKYISYRLIVLLLVLSQSVTFTPKSVEAAGVVYSFLYPSMTTRDSGGTGSVDPAVGKLLLAVSLAATLGMTINVAAKDIERDQKAQQKLLRLLEREPKRVKRALFKQEGTTYEWLVKDIAKLDKTTRRPVFDCIISHKSSELRKVFKLKKLRVKQQRIVSILREGMSASKMGLTTHRSCKELWRQAIEKERANRR